MTESESGGANLNKAIRKKRMTTLMMTTRRSRNQRPKVGISKLLGCMLLLGPSSAAWFPEQPCTSPGPDKSRSSSRSAKKDTKSDSKKKPAKKGKASEDAPAAAKKKEVKPEYVYGPLPSRLRRPARTRHTAKRSMSPLPLCARGYVVGTALLSHTS